MLTRGRHLDPPSISPLSLRRSHGRVYFDAPAAHFERPLLTPLDASVWNAEARLDLLMAVRDCAQRSLDQVIELPSKNYRKQIGT